MKLREILITTAILTLGSSVLASTAPKSVVEPTIRYNSGERSHSIALGQDAQKAFSDYKQTTGQSDLNLIAQEEYSPKVQDIFIGNSKSSPMATTGDFNGDGVQDIVGSCRRDAKHGYVFLSLMSENGKYRAREIMRWSTEEFNDEARSWADKRVDTYPRLVAKEKVEFVGAGLEKLNGRDVIQLEKLFGHTDMIYFDGNSFISSDGSDVRAKSAPPLQGRNHDRYDPRQRYIRPVGIEAERAVYRRVITEGRARRTLEI